jgi:hypothetical protein
MQTWSRRAATAVLTALITTGCGGGSDSPTSPSPTASTPTRVIAVSGSLAFGEVPVGSQRDATFTIANTGTAALAVSGISVSGGFVSQSTASWTTGTVAPGGTQAVTIRFAPTTAGSYAGTLTVNGDQTSGTNTIPISATATAAGFAGAWSGSYVVEACDGTGSIQDLFCSNNRGLFPPGSTLPISMNFNQNGSSVSGTFAFGQVTGVGNGVVNGQGVLTLQGTATSGTISASIASWSTSIQNGQMVGTITYNFTERSLPGVASVRIRLTGVTRR